jgi:hypothetical protein
MHLIQNPKSEGLIGGFPANERSPNPKSKIALVGGLSRRASIQEGKCRGDRAFLLIVQNQTHEKNSSD